MVHTPGAMPCEAVYVALLNVASPGKLTSPCKALMWSTRRGLGVRALGRHPARIWHVKRLFPVHRLVRGLILHLGYSAFMLAGIRFSRRGAVDVRRDPRHDLRHFPGRFGGGHSGCGDRSARSPGTGSPGGTAAAAARSGQHTFLSVLLRPGRSRRAERGPTDDLPKLSRPAGRSRMVAFWILDLAAVSGRHHHFSARALLFPANDRLMRARRHC